MMGDGEDSWGNHGKDNDMSRNYAAGSSSPIRAALALRSPFTMVGFADVVVISL